MLRSAVLWLSLVVVAACSGGAPPTAAPTDAPTAAPTAPHSAAPTPAPQGSGTPTPSGNLTVELCAEGWFVSPATCGGEDGDRFLFVCPPGGQVTAIYGTDTYTDDSSACVAAVHAGLITFAAGGSVIVELTPGLDSYESSSRNGVDSSSWGSWGQSFVFVGGPVAVATPTAGVTPDMPPGDPLVLAHIPPAFNVNCNAVTTFAAGEVAAVQCTPPQVSGYITYVLFEDENGPLDAWFDDLEYFAPGVSGSDCSAGPCLVGWTGTSGLVEGRYFANNYTGIEADGLIAAWFDAGERILASLVVHDTTFAELYDLALQAGPIH